MISRFVRYSAALLLGFFVLGLFSIDVDAKRQRKRRTRARTVRTAPRPVVTNPAIAPPGSEGAGTTEERVISTAEENTAQPDAVDDATAPKKKTSAKSDDADMKQTIDALSDQVNRLNDKLSRMQENDRSLIDMERLTRAEQRAENLRAQQVDVESKLADLQAKLEQVEYSLKPEHIERSTAGYGTTRPEEARDTRKRQLENERSRLQAQIRILENSQQRLEASVKTADAEVDILRRRLETQQQRDESGLTQTETPPTTNRRRPR